ncbi:MAG: 16S rRNA (cytosine(967)-C(5))-methyltransferase RsmB [Syntrophomonadaceae bacterium]|nr:16S rRNA (cytosine(967)-C(5))-methyltransferase RsmB [Syntrophomonadaceae bacterium]
MKAREGALQVLYAVEVEGAYANLVLDRLMREASFSKRDRAFLTELVYGTLRWRAKVDWILSQVVRPNLEQLTPWIRNILRLGIYQLLFMEKIPPSAVCNEGTNLAKRYGHQGVARLVNGVLRNVVRRGKDWSYPKVEENPVEHIAVCYSHPQWIVERWIERYGLEDTMALCSANNQPADNWIRTNTLRTSPAELTQCLKQEGVEVEASNLVPEGLKLKQISAYPKLPGFAEGWFQVQDESSMLAAHGLKPWPGARIIDACAAPGGKTTHLAQLMGNQGEILALDWHPHKIELIKENCQRLGINIVQAGTQDARELPGPWLEWADGVLVDAPCSGLGVLRRRSDARWRKQPEQIAQLTILQLEILLAAGQCVRPGGVLLYSTCTIEPEENELLVQKFISTWGSQFGKAAGFRLEEIGSFFPAGFDRKADRQQMAQGYLTLLPHIHGTDGFFLARLRREE